ncbi:MerR family DNA-binding transcriptional regulator [Microbacterium sp. MMO-20]|uniref:MerR family DNA-binding transcriptional regulator n=1 Tax=unclassified Microbacterium TaxID=2609290 RepID=UPI003FA5A800
MIAKHVQISEDERISTSAAAALLGVHPQTLRQYERQGAITSLRTPGGHRRFRLGDVRALAADSGASGVVGVEPQTLPTTPEGPVADSTGPSTLTERAS